MASSHSCWELVLLCISSVLICNLSAGFASTVSSGASCEANFSGFPYEPTGDCVNFGKSQRKPTPQCCRNVLTALTHELALRSRSSQGNFFTGQDQWRNCGSNFTKQPSVLMESCGYCDLFYESSHCSRLSSLGIVGRQSLIAALKECSNFNSSFGKANRKCVHAIMRARDDLMVGDEGEKTVCEVAVVIAISASKLEKPDLVYKFERCLPALDNIASDNYVEIKPSAVESIFAIFLATSIWVVLKLIMHVRCKKPAEFIPLNDVATCSGLYRFSKSGIECVMNIGNEKVSSQKGSAGYVYKGILPSGQEVAIKYITRHLANAFKWEVEGLSRVRHPNLVCLFGYCIEDGKHYLVYEYCSGGNLAEHLQREDAVLTWKTRVKIVRDCAVALRYLHHYADGYIVHGNIKLTNILLEAKISNFCPSENAQDGSTRNSWLYGSRICYLCQAQMCK